MYSLYDYLLYTRIHVCSLKQMKLTINHSDLSWVLFYSVMDLRNTFRASAELYKADFNNSACVFILVVEI